MEEITCSPATDETLDAVLGLLVLAADDDDDAGEWMREDHLHKVVLEKIGVWVLPKHIRFRLLERDDIECELWGMHHFFVRVASPSAHQVITLRRLCRNGAVG